MAPLDPRRRAGHGLAAALAVTVAVALSLAPRPLPVAPAPAPPRPPPAPAGEPELPAPPRPVALPSPRADEKLQRGGRTAFSGGYLAITPDFSSPDGVYDLVLHFHGNTELVEESLAHAHVGAVFVPQNL